MVTSLVVIELVHVHCHAIHEAEDDTPVPGYAHAPLVAPVARQRVQPVAGNFFFSSPSSQRPGLTGFPRIRGTRTAGIRRTSPRSKNARSPLCLITIRVSVTRYMPCYYRSGPGDSDGANRTIISVSNIDPVTGEARNFAVRETARELGEASISENTRSVSAIEDGSGRGCFPQMNCPSLARVATYLRIIVNTALARRRGCSDGIHLYLAHGAVIDGRVRGSLSQ